MKELLDIGLRQPKTAANKTGPTLSASIAFPSTCVHACITNIYKGYKPELPLMSSRYFNTSTSFMIYAYQVGRG